MALDLASDQYRQKRHLIQIALAICITLSILLAGCLFILLKPAHAATADDFVTTWKTDNPGASNSTSITIPTSGGGYNYSVDWNNDGTFDQFGVTGNATHDFGSPGTYTIRIQGSFPQIYFANSGDCQKIIDINQWGAGAWRSMDSAFWGAVNLVGTATDAPDLSNVNDTYAMFKNDTSFIGNASNWNTSNVTFAREMFNGASAFNRDLSNWDVSNVTNMDGMFGRASAFNSDLSNWDVSNVTNMSGMFGGASAFNSDLSNWNTSNVTNMNSMFAGASAFNSDLSNWNTGNVTDMSGMFAGASVFNSNISGWGTGNLVYATSMFSRATTFNHDLSSWDTSKITTMDSMFYGATSFKGNISGWNTSNVTDMRSMFNGATSFNGNISSWDTSKVTRMESMFYAAIAFNHDLSIWDTSKVTNMRQMFQAANIFNANISAWNTSNVTDMSYMFWAATSFNGNISGWDTSKVTRMDSMFTGATTFNHDLSSWDTSKITTMDSMFNGATSFNQSLSSWAMGGVNTALGMLSQSGISSANYDATLVGWSSQVLQHNVSLGAQGLVYCFAKAARQNIIDTYNWNITDAQCAPPSNVKLGGSTTANVYSSIPSGGVLGILSANSNVPANTQLDFTIGCQNPSPNDNLFEINDDHLVTTTQLRYDSNPGASNSYQVCVEATNAYNRYTDQIFTVNVEPPVISGVDPSPLTVDGTTQPAVIYGQGFQEGARVYLGSNEVTVGSVSPTQIDVLVPTSGITTTTIVNVTVVNPDGVAASLADGFTYYVAPVAPEKIVTSVDFSEETGKKLLTITGTGLVGGSNPGEYVEAIIRSLVTLNNTALPFCAEGLGVSAQDIIDAYAGAGYDLNGLVSDNPPCYDLIKDGSTVAIDQTHATIQLPDNFDTTAQGTVSVNGSNTYTFNATGGGPVTPSANVNGDKSLGDTPTIPKRPTFSGTAEPGATITVTVHSDPVICTTTADSSGNWSCTLPSDLEPGVHTVFIHIVNPNSSIVDLGPYTVTVAGTTITNNTPLGPNTGFLQAIKEHKAQASLKQTVTIAGVSTTIILLVGITGFVVRKKRSSRIVFNR